MIPMLLDTTPRTTLEDQANGRTTYPLRVGAVLMTEQRHPVVPARRHSYVRLVFSAVITLVGVLLVAVAVFSATETDPLSAVFWFWIGLASYCVPIPPLS
jgi:hypothetical protein